MQKEQLKGINYSILYSILVIILQHKYSTLYLRDDQFKGRLELLNVGSQTIHQLPSFIGIKESHILPETKNNNTDNVNDVRWSADVVHPRA